MPDRNSNVSRSVSSRDMPTRIREINVPMSTRKKELNDLADEKFIEYWANQEPKENKRIFEEYIALVKQANKVK
jgi:hypothetical protein